MRAKQVKYAFIFHSTYATLNVHLPRYQEMMLIHTLPPPHAPSHPAPQSLIRHREANNRV